MFCVQTASSAISKNILKHYPRMNFPAPTNNLKTHFLAVSMNAMKQMLAALLRIKNHDPELYRRWIRAYPPVSIEPCPSRLSERIAVVRHPRQPSCFSLLTSPSRASVPRSLTLTRGNGLSGCSPASRRPPRTGSGSHTFYISVFSELIVLDKYTILTALMPVDNALCDILNVGRSDIR
jgi:hypothetical protein